MRYPVAMERLTPAQLRLLAVLREREQGGRGPVPGIAALAEALGLRSRGSLHRQVAALTEAGLLEPMRGQRRGLHMTDMGRTAARQAGGVPHGLALPVLGEVAAGQPLSPCLAPDGGQSLEVPDALVTGGADYVLRVNGDSMVDAGIHDGDWAVISRARTARGGDIVVALVDGMDVTLKRLELRESTCVLHPENAAMAPLELPHERVELQGVLVAQMRSY